MAPVQGRPRESCKPDIDKFSKFCAPCQCWNYFRERTTSVRGFQSYTDREPQVVLRVHESLFRFDALARIRQYVLALCRAVGFAACRQGNRIHRMVCEYFGADNRIRRPPFLPGRLVQLSCLRSADPACVGPSSADDRQLNHTLEVSIVKRTLSITITSTAYL